LCIADIGASSIATLLRRFGLNMIVLAPAAVIPGSFWGEREAGLVRDGLYVRDDTPLHSALHEACHFICMDAARRARLECDAGGDYDEENAVCYLQILLADQLDGVGRDRMCEDMDAWGYTFRLGSAKEWFERDAEDAYRWLAQERLIDSKGTPTWLIRN
jgi:hypothetical protein